MTNDRTWLDRAVTEVGWYTPELTGAVVAAAVAATVAPWALLMSASLLGWIAVHRVLTACRNRKTRTKARRLHADQERLDRAAATTQPLKLVQGEQGEWEVTA